MSEDIYSYIKQLERRVDILERHPQNPDTWHELDYSNGWSEYNASYPARYTKINGVVYIKGLIAGGTTTDGTEMFLLPTGYRPASKIIFTALAYNQDLYELRFYETGYGLCYNLTTSLWVSVQASFPVLE